MTSFTATGRGVPAHDITTTVEEWVLYDTTMTANEVAGPAYTPHPSSGIAGTMGPGRVFTSGVVSNPVTGGHNSALFYWQYTSRTVTTTVAAAYAYIRYNLNNGNGQTGSSYDSVGYTDTHTLPGVIPVEIQYFVPAGGSLRIVW